MKKPKTTRVGREMPGQPLAVPDTPLEVGDSSHCLIATVGKNCWIKPFLNS